MWFSPELQRNLWLQLSWGRLLAAPILIGMVVAALLASWNPAPGHLAEYARWGFVLVLALWSTRRVADSLAEEVGGGTWESQRMSGMSAWSMVWGKLIGGAAFPWYCALICLGLMVWFSFKASAADLRIALGYQVGTLVLAAVLAQATALVVALLLLRKAQFRRRLTVTMAQIAGLLAFSVAVYWEYSAVPLAAEIGTVRWYRQEYPANQFYLGSVAIFTVWTLVAAWRLMRAELLYVNRPWMWTLFTLFCMGYAAGFVPWNVEPLTSRLASGCVAALVLTYAAFFAEAKDPVRYRWGLARFKALHWWRALEFTPWWLISYVLAAIAGIGTIWSIMIGGELAWLDSWQAALQRYASVLTLGTFSYVFAALLLFALRDMLFLLWLNFTGKMRGRADLSGLVLLVVAYGPLPMLLIGAGATQFLPAVWPLMVTDLIALAWPAAEVIIVGILLLLRWRQATRIEILADDREEPSIGSR
jgi:hypothetical protein